MQDYKAREITAYRTIDDTSFSFKNSRSLRITSVDCFSSSSRPIEEASFTFRNKDLLDLIVRISGP